MYSVGWLVAYLTVLLVVAEPLRNAGKYTMADVLAYRLSPRPVRAMAALSTLTVSTFYMIAQMVGAGALVALLLKDSGISYHTGGDRRRHADDRLRGLRRHAGDHLGADHQGDPADGRHDPAQHPGAGALRFQLRDVLRRHRARHLSTSKRQAIGTRLPQPGLRYKPPYGALDLISLGLALIFGTAGLPHILVRFYTVPDAKTARMSVVWAMVLIGSFYIMTTFLGFGAATIVGRDFIATNGGTK